uniref:Sushi domain-containing protein n=1 Tax=Magallana gigas TaxID=29159 RepID=A0A8W8NY77_MAGGI
MITSFDKYSILDCVEDCLRTTRCRSINYCQGAHFCQTNFENRTSVPELYIEKPGWIYTDIEDWDKKIAGACSRSSCRINEKCIPQPFDQFTCVISDCGVPKGEGFSMEHVREWDAIGITRRMQITCADKHNQLGSERFVCRSNGTWRSDLSCPENFGTIFFGNSFCAYTISVKV